MIATTRGALLRGSEKDDLGDEVASLEPVETSLADRDFGRSLADFPLSLIERSRREFDEASGAWRTIRFYAGRVPSYVPARAGDMIRDNRDGRLFIVEEGEGMARGISGRGSVTLTLKRTGS